MKRGISFMKQIQNFLSFVEISTKLASVMPFIVGTGYAMYRYGTLRPKQVLVFFAAMLLFDMTTTAINNHIGHRQTGRSPHYAGAVSIIIIVAMGLTATVIGVYLAAISNLAVLLVGVLCFGVGFVYSYGPLPIARTPFGELFSGVIMGVCIPFIAVELVVSIVDISFEGFRRVVVTADLMELLALGVVVVPLVCCIANIMLANNICDIEEDVKVQRYTLPFYIGVKNALRLYGFLYIAAYLFIIAGAVIRAVPIFTLTLLFTAVAVKKNVRRFIERQDKSQTFFTAILNFLAITVPYAACIWLGSLLRL